MKKRLFKFSTAAMVLAAGAASAAEPVIFTEGFNSDYSSQWTANISSAFGNAAPGITNSGTAGFEGDGFAVINWDRADTDGAVNVTQWNHVDLEVVQLAGVTYTFTGDFGWRNGSTNAINDVFIHSGQSGFNGNGDVPTNFEIGSIPSNTLQTVSFSYTTVEADVGAMLTLKINLADKDFTNSVVELLADDWNVTKSVFYEGFNSDFSSQWDTYNSIGFGVAAPGITNAGTAGFEGDAFAVKLADSTTIGATSIDHRSYANLPTVEAAGIKYTFTGELGWRNGSSNAVADLFFHTGQSGFNGQGSVSALEISSIPSNTLQTITFSYTTDEDDVGGSLQLRVNIADRNTSADSVELIADNWLVTAEIDTVVPFAETPYQNDGNNLIPNGEFDQVSNIVVGASTETFNLNGSFGDFNPFWGSTADLVGWTPFQDDPNGLSTNVGTPHADDGGVPVLDGTFYLDTTISTNISEVTLNSAMDYRNGLVQSNALDGVSIDSGKIYQFVVGAGLPEFDTTDTASGFLTAALTDGSGVPISGAIRTDVIDLWGEGQTHAIASVSGTDLIAAGQVNVSFDQVCTNDIPEIGRAHV